MRDRYRTLRTIRDTLFRTSRYTTTGIKSTLTSVKNSMCFRLAYQFAYTYLHHICLFICSVCTICILYLNLNAYLEISLGFLIAFISSIGASYVEYREKRYEDEIEATQTLQAQRLLSLGQIKKPSIAMLGNSAMPALEAYQSEIIGKTIEIAHRQGLALESLGIEANNKADRYTFRSPVKVERTDRALRGIPNALKNELDLSGIPVVDTPNQKTVSIMIQKVWLPLSMRVS